MLDPFHKIQLPPSTGVTGNVTEAVERNHDALERALRPVTDLAILDGVLISDQAITTAVTSVPHTLGRAYRGWIVVDKQGDARVWRSTASTADVTKFLALDCSANVTVSLWVF